MINPTQIPLVASIASIEVVNLVPTNGFEWVKLAVQLALGIFGYLQHIKLSKQENKSIEIQQKKELKKLKTTQIKK